MDYEVGIKNMIRRDLEEFATKAAKTMETLENENRQLRFDIETAKTIDLDVINQWRDWTSTMDAERERWAELATNISIENKKLLEENKRMRYISERILETLDSIAKIAHDHADPKRQSMSLVRTLEQIKDAANQDKGKILQFFIDPNLLNEEIEQQEIAVADEQS
jgi:hypothetical protein